MQPTITVDATKAYARFSEAGIPETVRNNLRRLLPGLGKDVGAEVESQMATKLKSHATLSVQQLMIEDPSRVIAQITLVSPSANGLLPTYLELGTRPHEIVGNPFLAFFWDKMGIDVVFRRVNHPGTPAYRIMEDAMAAMEADIVDTLNEAVQGLNE